MQDLTVIVDELLDQPRCERCGVVPGRAPHPQLICARASERNDLAADGWVDLWQLWPHVRPAHAWRDFRRPDQPFCLVADRFPEHCVGPGWVPRDGSFGLDFVDPGPAAWVRVPGGDAATAVAACVGLDALRPGRAPEDLATQVLAMTAPGQRSLARPNRFEVLTTCRGERHHLVVHDGRLVARAHRVAGRARKPHRHTVRAEAWEASLATAAFPMDFDHVAVAADPCELRCQDAIDTWDAGLPHPHVTDITGERPTLRTRVPLQALVTAAALVERTAQVALHRELRRRGSSDVTLDLVTTFAAPGARPTVEYHHFLSAIRVSVPADWTIDPR